MRKISILIALFSVLVIYNANAQNCCKPSLSMKAMALMPDFKAAHEAPLPFNFTPVNGKMMTFPVAGGTSGGAFFIPSKKTSNKVLLVFHEWWGLNDYIKQEAEKLQVSLGDVDVYAVDLYDGKVASEPEEAGKLMGGLKAERGKAIVDGLIKHIGTGKKIATIGWCMGGTWSFNGAMGAGNEAVGCVMYYGFPEADDKKIKPLKADVLYIRGNQDKFITKESVDQFGTRVKATKHNFTLHSYDAPHAFANPSNPKFDKDASEEAYGISVKFLKSKLGQ